MSPWPSAFHTHLYSVCLGLYALLGVVLTSRPSPSTQPQAAGTDVQPTIILKRAHFHALIVLLTCNHLSN